MVLLNLMVFSSAVMFVLIDVFSYFLYFGLELLLFCATSKQQETLVYYKYV